MRLHSRGVLSELVGKRGAVSRARGALDSYHARFWPYCQREDGAAPARGRPDTPDKSGWNDRWEIVRRSGYQWRQENVRARTVRAGTNRVLPRFAQSLDGREGRPCQTRKAPEPRLISVHARPAIDRSTTRCRP